MKWGDVLTPQWYEDQSKIIAHWDGVNADRWVEDDSLVCQVNEELEIKSFPKVDELVIAECVVIRLANWDHSHSQRIARLARVVREMGDRYGTEYMVLSVLFHDEAEVEDVVYLHPLKPVGFVDIPVSVLRQ